MTENIQDKFIEKFKSLLQIKDRQIRIKKATSFIFINFYNLPVIKDGAEAENNRMMFSIEIRPDGKIKVSQMVSAFPREYNMRGKTGKPEVIASYLADYLNKFVEKV